MNRGASIHGWRGWRVSDEQRLTLLQDQRRPKLDFISLCTRVLEVMQRLEYCGPVVTGEIVLNFVDVEDLGERKRQEF